MFFFVVGLSSYVFGCLSIILLVIFLYIQFGLSAWTPEIDYPSYEKFYPLSQYDVGQNSTVDTINSLIYFLFQEVRDTSAVRQHLTKKINVELNELQATRFGRLFLRQIFIHNFSVGRQSPILSDIQLCRIDKKHSENRPLIERVVARVKGEYKNGFSLVLNIKLPLDFQCQVYVHVKRIQADLRIEFRHEPFSHWLMTLEKEPELDIDMKVYLSNRQCFLVPRFIIEQIRRSLRRKQMWPKYKIRYKPFFPRSIDFLPEEPLVKVHSSLTSSIRREEGKGILQISVQQCDRLNIPKGLLTNENSSSLFVYVTLDMNAKKAEDYLQLNREQWTTIELDIDFDQHRIRFKETMYNDHSEILIDEFHPLTDDINDAERIRTALEEKNLFLFKLDGQTMKNVDEADQFLKLKSVETEKKKIQMLLAIPVLQSVRISYRIPLSEDATQRNRGNFIRQEMTLMMMNAELVDILHWRSTEVQSAESFVEFSKQFDFRFENSADEFLNVYLWCKAPPDFDLPILENRSILLGYATASLPEMFFHAHMSFGRETQTRLNFRSATSWKINSERENFEELRTHRGFDENLTHGFVTLNIKHIADGRPRSNSSIRRDFSSSNPNSPEDDFFESQYDEKTIPEENETTMTLRFSKHSFVDQTLSFQPNCDHCKKTISSKIVRQCRRCLKISHSKCEDEFSSNCVPTSPSANSRFSLPDLSKTTSKKTTSSSRSTEIRTTTAPAQFNSNELVDRYDLLKILKIMAKVRIQHENDPINSDSMSWSRHSPSRDQNETKNFRRRRFYVQKPMRALSFESNLNDVPVVLNLLEIGAVASAAYQKLLDFKAKRTLTADKKKLSIDSESLLHENIAEEDLQDILTTCRTDDPNEEKNLRHLLHENAVDHTILYSRAKLLAPKLFNDLPLNERKQKLDCEIERLEQDIRLQREIRDELVVEYNDVKKSENDKKKIEMKIENIDEKIQASSALTILYCAGVQYCCRQIEKRNSAAQ